MLNLKATLPERLFAALQAAGMPEVPGEFSVVPRHQVLPSAVLAEIAGFIRVFDQVTTHEAWQAAARREAPAIAQLMRPEVCFFSAWDFHLPPEGGSQLIEFNDNGSGLLFAAIINALYYEAGACDPLYDAFLRLTITDLDGSDASNSLMSAGICLYPWTRRNCFSATNSPDPTQRSRWSLPCQRFTFRQTCSTIENADSITLVLAIVFRNCIGT